MTVILLNYFIVQVKSFFSVSELVVFLNLTFSLLRSVCSLSLGRLLNCTSRPLCRILLFNLLLNIVFNGVGVVLISVLLCTFSSKVRYLFNFFLGDLRDVPMRSVCKELTHLNAHWIFLFFLQL